jgi:hypothetical protein
MGHFRAKLLLLLVWDLAGEITFCSTPAVELLTTTSGNYKCCLLLLQQLLPKLKQTLCGCE